MSSSSKRKNDFLVHGSILAVASIASRLIGILYRIPVTNIIGEDGIADYSNAFEIYSIVLILSSFSLPLSVSKLVSARHEKKEYINSYRMFLCAMGFAIASGTIFAIILYFGADFFATTIFKMESSAIPLRVLAPTVFISAIMGVLRGFYQGKKTMIPTALSQILEQVVNAIVSISASYYFMKRYSASEKISAYGAAGSTLGTTLGAVAALIFLLLIFYAYRPTVRKQMKRDPALHIESYKSVFTILVITIIPVILSQTVYQISGVLDNAMFGHIMAGKGIGIEERKIMLGVYSGKYRVLTNLPIAIASALATSMIPTVVSAHVREAYGELKDKIHSVIHFNMLIAFPCAVGMSVLAGPIIQLLFPGSSPIAAKLLQVGSIAIIFYALSTVSNAILQGISQMRIPVIHSAISLIVHIIVVYICLAIFNLQTYGLVIGNISFALLVCVLNWRSIAKILDYKQEVKKTFLLPGAASLGMGVFTWLSYKGVYLLIKSNTISTLVAIIIGIASYFVLLLLLKGIEAEDLIDFPMGRTLTRIGERLHILKV